MLRLLIAALVLLPLLGGCAETISRGSAIRNARVTATASENQHARHLLCADLGEEACLAACSNTLAADAHVDCLLGFRFGSDPLALEMARALYRETHTLVGVVARGSIEGFRGEVVELFPALPIGEHRHHLGWLHESLTGFRSFIDVIATRATSPVVFDPRPGGFTFFRTSGSTYPSAYCLEGLIGYNLDGPLHANPRDVHETLFHELFHLNDARHGAWSERALGPIFDAIVERCSADHDCFTPYSPFETVVPNGTYYAFDNRTKDVREYGAELAVRYFVEQERS